MMKGKAEVTIIVIISLLTVGVMTNFALAGTGVSATFIETGLIPGTSWSITINGITIQSTTDKIDFPSLADGTYDYTINEVMGYNATPTSGQLTISGLDTQIPIAFTDRTDTWWTFGRDVANTKYTTAQGPLTSDVLWSKHVSGGWSTPAIVNGVLFIGSNYGMSALNASTGDTLWSYPMPSEWGNSATVVQGVVYTASSDSNAYALNATTGSKIWNKNLGTTLHFSPAVVNGLFYIGGDNGNVYSLNSSTGEIVWSYYAGIACGFDVHPAVVNGIVYIGSGNGDQKLYALNASTGTKIWSYNVANTIYSAPIVTNGVVYFGSNDGYFYALNSSTGVKIWNFAGGVIYSSPAIANGYVYFGSGDRNIYAVNASTGVKIWSFLTGDQICGGPLVADRVVYIGSADRNFYAINATSGSLIWSYSTGGRIFGSAAIANGVIYVETDSTGIDVYAFGSNTPTSTPTPTPIPTPTPTPTPTPPPIATPTPTPITYTITPFAGIGGSIIPNTTQIVSAGAMPNFTITADNQFHISDVTINGSSVLSTIVNNIYTFSPIHDNFNISATFEINPTPTPTQTGSQSSSSSSTKTNPTAQPFVTPSPSPMPINNTTPPADDGENPVTSTPPNTSKNAVIGFFEEWSAVIGSGSLIGVAGIGLTMYGMRLNQRQRKAEKKAAEEKQEGIKRRRVTYIDQLKEFKGTKLTTDQIKKIQGIKENILVDHDLEKDEVQRLLDLVNHLLGK